MIIAFAHQRMPSEIGMDEASRRGLARLMLRWPHLRPTMKLRVRADPYLMDLCEAYEHTCVAFEYWSRSDAPVAAERVEEYRTLAADTEADILHVISLDG